MPDSREAYGRIVRETWVAWAKEQSAPKPSWLTGWDELDSGQREVDMRIGSAVAAEARRDFDEELITLRIQSRAALVQRDKATIAEADRIVGIARRLLEQMHPVGGTGMVDAVPFDSLIAAIRNRTQPEPPEGA